MSCARCRGFDREFSPRAAARALRRYRTHGADETTQLLAAALQRCGIDGLVLLDIGGGIGALQHALLRAGVARALSVEAAAATLEAAREEAARLGFGERIDWRHGDFVELAEELPATDIVTLDRVICCYPDMPELVGRAAARARRYVGAVYPRAAWWVRLISVLENLFHRLRRCEFRVYSHAPLRIEALLRERGLRERFRRDTLVWHVVVYERGTVR